MSFEVKLMQEREELIDTIRKKNQEIAILNKGLVFIASSHSVLNKKDVLLMAALNENKYVLKFILDLQKFLNDLDKYNDDEIKKGPIHGKGLNYRLANRLFFIKGDAKRAIESIELVMEVK